MQGIQYTVVGTFPPLYVIMKQRRNSPTNGNHASLIVSIMYIFRKSYIAVTPLLTNFAEFKNVL